MDYDAVVLAGGSARRLGGVDKSLLEVNGTSLLATAIAAVEAARSIVVVGTRRPGFSNVDWAIEDPVGSGPTHALAAGLERGSAPIAVVLAADYPFVTGATIERLAAAIGGLDGAIATDVSGRDQFLMGAYVRTAIAGALLEEPVTMGAPLGTIIRRLRLARVREETAAFDCDTWVDVAIARRRSPKEG